MSRTEWRCTFRALPGFLKRPDWRSHWQDILKSLKAERRQILSEIKIELQIADLCLRNFTNDDVIIFGAVNFGFATSNGAQDWTDPPAEAESVQGRRNCIVAAPALLARTPDTAAHAQIRVAPGHAAP